MRSNRPSFGDGEADGLAGPDRQTGRRSSEAHSDSPKVYGYSHLRVLLCLQTVLPLTFGLVILSLAARSAGTSLRSPLFALLSMILIAFAATAEVRRFRLHRQEPLKFTVHNGELGVHWRSHSRRYRISEIAIRPSAHVGGTWEPVIKVVSPGKQSFLIFSSLEGHDSLIRVLEEEGATRL